MEHLLTVALGFIGAAYAFESYIDWRQYKRLCNEKPPKILTEMKFNLEEFEKSRLYSLDKIKFSMVSNLYGTLQAILFIYFGVFSILWELSGYVLSQQTVVGSHEISKSCVFILLFQIISTVLGLPTSIYKTFVLEAKHGFNKQTKSLFIIDIIKGFGLFLVLGIPFAALFVFIVRWAGPGYFITYVYSFMLAVTVIAIVIFPIIIQPLFNKFTPLPDGELKEKLCALCNTVSFPVKKLFVVDGSTRSSHSNAYVFGLFKLERIVLYDTLVNSLTTDEIISVVGHELGHWKLGHFYRNIIASQLHTLLLLYLSEKFLFSKDLYVSFGFPANTEAPVLVGMILFQYIYIPVEQILSFFMNVNSRIMEFQADEFSAKLGYAKLLISSLRKMAVENKSDMNPDPWYSTFHYSHPPFLERIATLQAHKKTE